MATQTCFVAGARRQAQASEALRGAQLSAPGDVAEGFGLALLTHLEAATALGA